MPPSKNDIVLLTKTFVIYVAGPCKFHSYDTVITVVAGCTVGPNTRKCCDCVVHAWEGSTNMATQVQLT